MRRRRESISWWLAVFIAAAIIASAVELMWIINRNPSCLLTNDPILCVKMTEKP